jgi:hypothetical protein
MDASLPILSRIHAKIFSDPDVQVRADRRPSDPVFDFTCLRSKGFSRWSGEGVYQQDLPSVPRHENHATKINMNKAKAEDIVTAIGLTPEEAKALVAYARSMAITGSGAKCWSFTVSTAASSKRPKTR